MKREKSKNERNLLKASGCIVSNKIIVKKNRLIGFIIKCEVDFDVK